MTSPPSRFIHHLGLCLSSSFLYVHLTIKDAFSSFFSANVASSLNSIAAGGNAVRSSNERPRASGI